MYKYVQIYNSIRFFFVYKCGKLNITVYSIFITAAGKINNKSQQRPINKGPVALVQLILKNYREQRKEKVNERERENAKEKERVRAYFTALLNCYIHNKCICFQVEKKNCILMSTLTLTNHKGCTKKLLRYIQRAKTLLGSGNTFYG